MLVCFRNGRLSPCPRDQTKSECEVVEAVCSRQVLVKVTKGKKVAASKIDERA